MRSRAHFTRTACDLSLGFSDNLLEDLLASLNNVVSDGIVVHSRDERAERSFRRSAWV